MHVLIGSELSRMRARALRSEAAPRRRRPQGSLRVSIGHHLVEAGVRLMGGRQVAG